MARVHIENLNETLFVNRGGWLFEAVKTPEYPLRFGCQKGDCGSCLVKVIRGASNILPQSDKEIELLKSMGIEDGFRLACSMEIIGNITLSTDLLS